MSKRILLSVEESEWLAAALKTMRDQCTLDYQIIKIGKHEVDRLIAKVSQETAPTASPQQPKPLEEK